MPDTDDLTARLAAAGLPNDNLTARRADLPPGVQDLHHRILTAIATTGEAPSPTQLQDWTTQLDLQASSALRALDDAELIFISEPEPANAAVALPTVTGGVPFASGGRSAHLVQIHGGPEVAANCAVDALGIPAMVGHDASVRSTDPLTGEAVTATSRGGAWTWQPLTAVVFVGSNGSGRLTESCCPVINFFTDADHARTYQDRHHLTGDVWSLPEAARAGGLVFGDLLREPTTKPTSTKPNTTG